MSFAVLLISTKIGWLFDYFVGFIISGIITSQTIKKDVPSYKMKRILHAVFWPFYLIAGIIKLIIS